MHESLQALLRRRDPRMGWRPDSPDPHDVMFAVDPALIGKIPDPINLEASPFMPPIWDQGQLGSCTAHGSGAGFEYALRKEGAVDYEPSRLYIYYNGRAAEGTTDQDAGAMIRDVVKAIAKLGAPPETDWPYDISKFAQEPPASAYEDAKKDRAIVYRRVVQSTDQIRLCLASGFPVIFGCTLYESFESPAVARTGVVPMPGGDEQEIGGHCMLLSGANMSRATYRVRNSWGEEWGDHGYCDFPMAYLNDRRLASDFWMIAKIG